MELARGRRGNADASFASQRRRPAIETAALLPVISRAIHAARHQHTATIREPLLMVAIVVACALDISSYYLLDLKGFAEANPVVILLGPAAVLPKLLLAAGICLAILRRARYSTQVGTVAALAWAFGAATNLM